MSERAYDLLGAILILVVVVLAVVGIVQQHKAMAAPVAWHRIGGSGTIELWQHAPSGTCVAATRADGRLSGLTLVPSSACKGGQ